MNSLRRGKNIKGRKMRSELSVMNRLGGEKSLSKAKDSVSRGRKKEGEKFEETASLDIQEKKPNLMGAGRKPTALATLTSASGGGATACQDRDRPVRRKAESEKNRRDTQKKRERKKTPSEK